MSIRVHPWLNLLYSCVRFEKLNQGATDGHGSVGQTIALCRLSSFPGFGHFHAAAPHGWGMLARRAQLAHLGQKLLGKPAAGSRHWPPAIECLFHRNRHTLLAGDASDGDYDGLVAGRDIGRHHHVQLHDAGHQSGGFPGERPVGRLAADSDGDGQ